MTSLAASAFQQDGKIIAGSDVTFFPYEYMDNNKPAGFDIEFMDGLGKVMGRKVETLDTRFPNLITGLQAGQPDVTNSSMYITAERVKVIHPSGQAELHPPASRERRRQPRRHPRLHLAGNLCRNQAGHRRARRQGTEDRREGVRIVVGNCRCWK